MRWDETTRVLLDLCVAFGLLTTMYVLSLHLRHPEAPACATPDKKDR